MINDKDTFENIEDKEYLMTVTPTDFRKNLFKLLDTILETGNVLEIICTRLN